jgi:hypothetical protein
MESNNEAIKKSTQCPRCAKFYTDLEDDIPKILKCGHSFCKRCLLAMKYETKIMCPEDFKTTECQYIKDLPTNYAVVTNKISEIENSTDARMIDRRTSSLGKNALIESIIPSNFSGVNDYINEAAKGAFQCRDIVIDNETKRMLTIGYIDQAMDKTIVVSINPLDLKPFREDFYNGIKRCRFCWRYLTQPTGEKFRILTIEEDQSLQHDLEKSVDKLTPQYLKGINNFNEMITDRNFYWRIAKLDEGFFKAVTLE